MFQKSFEAPKTDLGELSELSELGSGRWSLGSVEGLRVTVTCISHHEISPYHLVIPPLCILYPVLYIIYSSHLMSSPKSRAVVRPDHQLACCPVAGSVGSPSVRGRLDAPARMVVAWWSRGGRLPRMEWWLCRQPVVVDGLLDSGWDSWTHPAQQVVPCATNPSWSASEGVGTASLRLENLAQVPHPSWVWLDLASHRPCKMAPYLFIPLAQKSQLGCLICHSSRRFLPNN